MTFAPAQAEEGVCRRAKELALNLARGFNLSGTLAIELLSPMTGMCWSMSLPRVRIIRAITL